MKVYKVPVEKKSITYYAIKANNENDAKEKVNFLIKNFYLENHEKVNLINSTENKIDFVINLSEDLITEKITNEKIEKLSPEEYELLATTFINEFPNGEVYTNLDNEYFPQEDSLFDEPSEFILEEVDFLLHEDLEIEELEEIKE